MNQVVRSSFLSSANSLHNAQCAQNCEIALLGRSNVGKSTLINALLNKPLARSSSTPGKTRLINFFESVWQGEDKRNFTLTFIDLPGFGYAKVSKDIKSAWEKNLLDFLLKRSSIKLFLHLIDARHRNLEIDNEVEALLRSLCSGDRNMLRIYTKADKLKQNELNMLSTIPSPSYPHLIFSATHTSHRKMTHIQQLRNIVLHLALGNISNKQGEYYGV